MEYIKLRNGEKLPMIAYGPDEVGYVAGFHPKKQDFLHKNMRRVKRLLFQKPKYVSTVATAIEAGFNYIDYAASYGDGTLINKAIKKARMRREDMILTTRIGNQQQLYGGVEDSLRSQLDGFHTDYVDILMFHWPVTDCYEKTWIEMMRLKEKGYCRILGVANCHQHHLERIKTTSGEYPEINQVECHPLFTQTELREFCRSKEIVLQAYTSTARQDDRLMNPPLLNKLSEKYKKSKSQIVLRWHVQNGVIPVFRSMNKSHIKENVDIFDFNIEDDDMKKIDSMNINSRLRYDPDNCDFSRL